jgi:hypothetical protein
MRLFLTVLILFLAFGNCFSQSETIVEGRVLDQESEQPIEFASVGIPADHIGTATNPEGYFSFEIPSELERDSLQVSAIGYDSRKIPVKKLKETTETFIRLSPKRYQMGDITVTDTEPQTVWVGKKVRPLLGGGAFGTAVGGKKVGAAFAFNISWKQSLPIQLLYARMFLERNESDGLTMRCRIASVNPESGNPGKDLVDKNIVTSVEKDSGWVTCDFTEEQIYLDQEEFFLVFEWLRDPEKPAVAPMFKTGNFFDSSPMVRDQILGKWKAEKGTSNLIYSLKVSY